AQVPEEPPVPLIAVLGHLAGGERAPAPLVRRVDVPVDRLAGLRLQAVLRVPDIPRTLLKRNVGETGRLHVECHAHDSSRAPVLARIERPPMIRKRGRRSSGSRESRRKTSPWAPQDAAPPSARFRKARHKMLCRRLVE